MRLLLLLLSIKPGTTTDVHVVEYESIMTKFSHSVLLHIECKHTFICGGSALNQGIVLTAAHCLEECKGESHVVVMQKYNLTRPEMIASVTMREYLAHAQYDEGSMANDVCLVLVSRAMSAARVTVLRSPPAHDQLGFVASWGAMNESHWLTGAVVPLMRKLQSASSCQVLGCLPPGTFCARALHRADISVGSDSGSALVSMTHVQVGLVSYLVRRRRRAVYTDVAHHYHWIWRTIVRLYCKNSILMNL